VAIAFKDIVERASRTEEQEEKVGVGSAGEVKKRENVLVRKHFPYCGFVFQAVASL